MIIVHIGSWKTGTTAFQHALRNSKRQLFSDNFGLLDTRDAWFSQEFLPLYRAYVKKFNSGKGWHDYLRESVSLFVNNIHNNEYENQVLSWEAALGHPLNSSKETLYHPNATAVWFEALNRQVEVKLSLVVRDQAELIQSMYSQEVRKGRYTNDFTSFLTDKLPKNLSWTAVVAPFVDLGLENNLRVIPYSSSRNGAQVFFTNIMWGYFDFSWIEPDIRKNYSLSVKAIEMMRKCSPMLNKEELRSFEKFLANNFYAESFALDSIASAEQIDFIRSLIYDESYPT